MRDFLRSFLSVWFAHFLWMLDRRRWPSPFPADEDYWQAQDDWRRSID